MKIVIAPNAFKGSLGACRAAGAIQKGLASSLGAAQLVLAPMADGGDSTLEALLRARPGRRRRTWVRGPLGRDIRAEWGQWEAGAAADAVVEMSRASGLALLKTNEYNPLRASSYGTGQMIEAALESGCEDILVGVGGSATVDGGAGMAAALGYRFLDARGREIGPSGSALTRIRTIDPSGYYLRMAAFGAPARVRRVRVICDVDNRLLGPQGAAAVFGPQKGASPRQVERLEAGLANLADAIRRDLGKSVRGLKGGGAAGGLAMGLHAFLGAEIVPGARFVAQAIGLEGHLRGADWVVTGEGQLDGQTPGGKAPGLAAEWAVRAGAGVIGVAGRLGPGYRRLLKRRGGHFDALFSICDGPASLESSMRRAPVLLERLARSIGALLAES